MATASVSTVQFLYKRVIDETIRTSRETFLNEGIEDNVLEELRTLWESKVAATRAVEPAMNPPDYIPRGQIYKYNYTSRNPLPQNVMGLTVQTGNTPTRPAATIPFPPHVSAFMPQHIQPRQPPAGPAPSSSQYPSSIPFPSLSAATTVTKKEFNNASDSIQVDGTMEIVLSNKGKRRLNKKPKQLDGADSDDDVGEFIDSDESEEDENEDTDEEIDVDDRLPSNLLPSGITDDINEPSQPVEEEDPLNSEDDGSDDGSTEFEATDNVVVCLYDKITRSKNKWKLYLKDGVMSICGKDHVFQKAIGDGEW